MPTKKASARKGGRINDLVQIQQRVAGRFAKLGSNVATRMSNADFSVAGWAKEYSDLWRGLADDLEQTMKVMSPENRKATKTRAKKTTKKR